MDGRAPLDNGYPRLATLGQVLKPANRTGSVATFLHLSISDAAVALPPRQAGVAALPRRLGPRHA